MIRKRRVIPFVIATALSLSACGNEAKDTLITGIQISGYTDSKGGYEYNLDLSQKRADTVRSYLLEKYPELDGVMTAKGLASKDLIINADGTVDDEKSRRVAFQMVFSSEQ